MDSDDDGNNDVNESENRVKGENAQGGSKDEEGATLVEGRVHGRAKSGIPSVGWSLTNWDWSGLSWGVSWSGGRDASNDADGGLSNANARGYKSDPSLGAGGKSGGNGILKGGELSPKSHFPGCQRDSKSGVSKSEDNLVGKLRKTVRFFASSLGRSSNNQNWNNSAGYDDFEYEENQMPLLLLDKQLDTDYNKYSRHSRSGENFTFCTCACVGKVVAVLFVFICVGVICGFVGFIVACIMGHKGTLTSDPVYNAIG